MINIKSIKSVLLLALGLTLSAISTQASIAPGTGGHPHDCCDWERSYTVSGKADPWLAKSLVDNIGTPEPADYWWNSHPVDVNLGSTVKSLSWTATGEVGHPGDISGPDGNAGVIVSHMVGAVGGVPNITSPINALIGVFTGSGSFAPQIFVMGSSGSVVVPTGAEHLYLGVMDSYGWANNVGGYCVDIKASCVPEPSTYLAGLSALGMLGAMGWRSRK